MTKQEVFDRITAIQHNTEYSFDATVEENHIETGLVVKGFLTSPTLHEIFKEFKSCYLTEEGLNLRD